MSTADAAPTRRATTRSAAARARFRPDVEGLRAVAVLAVLVYHAGLPVPAGFAGVDVFFVISGYLITGLLLTELDKTGRISWMRFLGRRIRRLLPAAVLVLAVVAAWSWWVVPGERLQVIGRDVRYAALYVVNWTLAGREVDYLASDLTPSPVQHFWSLAVEEQFYLVWPLLLLVVALVARRLGARPDRRVVGAVLGVLVLASFVWSVVMSRTEPEAAFFVTTTRVWELGVGALLAVWLTGRERPERAAPWTAVAGWAGLAGIVAVAVALPTDVDWPGAWALLATLPTALVLWAGWQGSSWGPVRLLGTRPMVWMGGMSYSVYLWHWPVIVLGGWTVEYLTGAEVPAWATVALAAASLWPAWVSWRYLEQPLHYGTFLRRRPRAMLAFGVALSAVGVAASVPLMTFRTPFETSPPDGPVPALASLGANTVVPGRAVANAADPGWAVPDPLLAGRDRPDADVDRCQVPAASTEPVACEFGDPDGAVTVALVGDSKAMQWLPALQERAVEEGWRVVTYGKSACAFSAAAAAEGGEAYPECDVWNTAVLDALTGDPPDVVVTSGVARTAETGAGRDRAALVEGYATQWRRLAEADVPVLVIGDSPDSPDDLDVCAAWNPESLDECTFPVGPAREASALPVQEEAVRAAGDGVRLLDLTERICPGGECPVVIGHVTVHRAGDHVTATYARTLAGPVSRAVAAALPAPEAE
ncbi:acyltransferase [Phycicoccus sp. BSK3Z-2]|uniref:Acyltransferase n=1 Tax=Phycicoccus avicenniae TaxID=2828860 RepID=A0A941HYC7_9MICO|nr:acyltransferase family protein [Phycicoccus avicenniae]MBR7742808.1 acyltransferase [Phycicoccus avicenniae]